MNPFYVVKGVSGQKTVEMSFFGGNSNDALEQAQKETIGFFDAPIEWSVFLKEKNKETPLVFMWQNNVP